MLASLFKALVESRLCNFPPGVLLTCLGNQLNMARASGPLPSCDKLGRDSSFLAPAVPSLGHRGHWTREPVHAWDISFSLPLCHSTLQIKSVFKLKRKLTLFFFFCTVQQKYLHGAVKKSTVPASHAVWLWLSAFNSPTWSLLILANLSPTASECVTLHRCHSPATPLHMWRKIRYNPAQQTGQSEMVKLLKMLSRAFRKRFLFAWLKSVLHILVLWGLLYCPIT